MTKKVYFVTFGAGATWPLAAQRLAAQAEKTGVFHRSECFTADRLFRESEEARMHKEFIIKNRRGFGYWLWKPILILSYLEKISELDVVFYLDAGFEFGQNRQELIKIIDHTNNVGNFILDYSKYEIFNIGYWSKPETHRFFSGMINQCDPYKMPMRSAGSIAFSNSNESRAFLRAWIDASIADAYFHINDDNSSNPNGKFFENRHDQVPFSFLCEKFGYISYGSAFNYDYTYEDLKKWPDIIHNPFIALRNSRRKTLIRPYSLNSYYRRAVNSFNNSFERIGTTERNAIKMTFEKNISEKAEIALRSSKWPSSLR